MQRIEDLGGMIRAIEERFPQREIERSAYEYQKTIESGATGVVGVNRYADSSPPLRGAFRIDASVAEKQRARLARFRPMNGTGRPFRAFSRRSRKRRAEPRISCPRYVDAVKGNCTLGEISRAMESVFGRYNPASAL